MNRSMLAVVVVASLVAAGLLWFVTAAQAADEFAAQCESEPIASGWVPGHKGKFYVAISGEKSLLGENTLISRSEADPTPQFVLCADISPDGDIGCGSFEEQFSATETVIATSVRSQGVAVSTELFEQGATVPTRIKEGAIGNCPTSVTVADGTYRHLVTHEASSSEITGVALNL